MTTPARSPVAGLAQVCAAGVLWGTGGLAVQVIREHSDLSALTVSGYRTLIAAVVLVVVVLGLRRWSAAVRLLRERPVQATTVGLLTAAYQALYFTSVAAVGVTVSTVVSLGLAPVLLTLLDAWRRRSAPSRAEVATVAAALSGLALVSLNAGAGSTGPHPVLGVVAALASGTAYAAATTVGEPLAREHDPIVLTAVSTTAGSLGIVPLALVVALVTDSPVTTTDPFTLGTLLYLGAMTMSLAYVLLYAGLRTTSPSAAVVATLLEPVTAALVAAAFLAERLGPPGIVGGLLILAAVGSLGRRPPDPVSPPVPPPAPPPVPPPA